MKKPSQAHSYIKEGAVNIWQWILLVIVLLPVALTALAFPVRTIAMRFMNPMDAQMFFFIFASPLISLHDMWEDLVFLPRRWRQKQDQQEFYRFFGFAPAWDAYKQDRVHDKLFDLAMNVWQMLTSHDGYYNSLAENEKQRFLLARNIAEHFGYAVLLLQEYIETVAQNGRPRRSESE